MRDDVVEQTGREWEVDEVERVEGEIRQAERSRHLPGALDGTSGEIEAHELAPGEAVCHRDEICPVAAPDLQDAAARRW